MTDWIPALAALAEAGRPAVLVTVLRAQGSTPREAGTKMVVSADALHGTIGGGHLELVAVETARGLLADAAAGRPIPGPVIRELPLGPSLGQCCGGHTTLVFEAILPVRWQVAVFGAGHVGKALVKLLGDLPCAVTWIDAREGELPAELPPRVRAVVSDAPEDEVGSLPAGADILVMTHSHAVDLQIVEAVLRRGDQRYLGLIGSRTKRARFEQRLRARGRSAEDLARLTCPIGVPGIRGKHPAVIAIAVAAELLQLRGAGEVDVGSGSDADVGAGSGAGEAAR
jgi:xanthine dehydrogenase accessory factor